MEIAQLYITELGGMVTPSTQILTGNTTAREARLHSMVLVGEHGKDYQPP